MDSGVEVWGGIECTVNRIGDRFLDQLQTSGHDRRPEDLSLLSTLGITKVRYPVLWERVAPHGVAHANWDWTDERLEMLRTLDIEPIVGLLHHGSGPRYTHLLDEAFPAKLAEFAAAVARRYPWVRYFTPINEPLTTARFSALYGLWYPHERSDVAFLRALILQCRAICEAMAAIREVSPHALLVQTEDLGKTYSTAKLRYQADFENARRWFSIDLLAGTEQSNAPMMRYCAEQGIDASKLRASFPQRFMPDILGFNYYITSERYLDHRTQNYEPHTHGGNDRERYADVAAARVCIEGPQGVGELALEAWERYHAALAITESHLNCTREEQMRWIHETYQQAQRIRERGVDMRAVTAWSLFGAYDWANLLTSDEGAYEPGAFDLRAPAPRRTAVAKTIAQLGQKGPLHPVLDVEGWWHRPVRFEYPPVFRESRVKLRHLVGSRYPARCLMLTSASSVLGKALLRACNVRGLHAHILGDEEFTCSNEGRLRELLDDVRPWAIVDSLDWAQLDVPLWLARWCAERDVPLMAFSTSGVFDGRLPRPYIETDRILPIDVYGRIKARMEEHILQSGAQALICRCDVLFGDHEQSGALHGVMTRLGEHQSVDVASDVTCSPVYVEDVAHAALDLFIDDEIGLWHLSHGSGVNWAHFIALLAQHRGLSPYSMKPRLSVEIPYAAVKPRNTALISVRGQLLPPLEDALKRAALGHVVSH